MSNSNYICHVELPVTNLEQASEFYENVFGYKVNTEAMSNYGLVSLERVSIGMPLVEKIEQLDSRIYIQVSNIDETLSKVEKNGGEVVSEKNLISKEIGFGAKFKDTFGNNVGLFSPE